MKQRKTPLTARQKVDRIYPGSYGGTRKLARPRHGKAWIFTVRTRSGTLIAESVVSPERCWELAWKKLVG